MTPATPVSQGLRVGGPGTSPFGARGMSSVRYRTRIGDLKNKQSTERESAHDSASRVGVRERLDLASAPASRRRARLSLARQQAGHEVSSGVRALATVGVRAPVPLGVRALPAPGPRPMQDCCRGSRRLPADKLSVGSTGCLGWSLPPSGSVRAAAPPGCGVRLHRRADTAPFPCRRRAARTDFHDVPCAERRNAGDRTSGSQHS